MFNGPENLFYKPDFDDSRWADINVPGNWEVQGFEEPVYKEPREGVGLYRRSFNVPASWKDRRIFVRFEGVLYGFEFWINGKHAGKFESAFNRSEYDITGFVNLSKSNVIAVRAYRRYKGWQFDTHDAWALSGIYRDVILFSAPPVHIHDLTIITPVKKNLKDAEVQSRIKISAVDSELSVLRVKGILKDKDGQIVNSAASDVSINNNRIAESQLNMKVSDPLLWNAETPNLYTLQIDLLNGKDTIHSVTRKVGIRQLSIDGDVLKLNYTAIKLRGVDHHDIHPDAGRALREEHYREDIELMKSANINAVRTSHYPPNPVFLDLCDEYGIYVICEVPFGFGDKNLSDSSYGDILLSRADATVARDKNHASVIIWSVGNENPITPIVVKTADRVKELDPTRYRLLPGAQVSDLKSPVKGDNLTEFAEKTKFIFNLPESVEIAAPHYPYVKEVPGRERNLNLTDLAVDKSVTRPVVCTEYNHSLGSAFEGLSERWEVIQANARLAGAFIWLWADQGIRRNITGKKVLTGAAERLVADNKESIVCADVWLDEKTVLDSHGGFGTDGIVYADRFPQVDYWITKKVYSRVIIPDEKLSVHPGKQRLEIPVLNRYDFTDLDKLHGKWELLHNGTSIQSGNISVTAPPRGKTNIIIDTEIGNDLNTSENLLKIKFADFNGRDVYEHSLQIVPASGNINYKKILSGNLPALKLKTIKSEKNISSCGFGNFILEIDRERGKIKIIKPDSGDPVLEGPLVRVGRDPVMAEYRNYPRYDTKFWENPLLAEGKVIESKVSNLSKNGADIKMKLDYHSLDKDRKNESVMLNMTIHLSPKGLLDINYELTPQNATGNFLDFGLAFRLQDSMNTLTWIGDGPFNSYPGQTDAAERGIWQIAPKPMQNPESRYYEGDRANVDLAVVADGNGNGLAFLCNDSSISLEEKNGNRIFSQILLSSGKGNKTGGMLTLLPVKASEIKCVKGTISLIPIESGKWPDFIKNLKASEL